MQNIKLYRLTFIITIIFVCSLRTYAQFDGHFSLFQVTKPYYNPASIGAQDMMKVQAAQRIQTAEIKNAPLTTFFSAHTPFTINKTHHAAGIEFINDIFGIFSNQQINLQYAYKFKFKQFNVSVGANIGVMNITCYGDSVKLVESEYHTENDPAIPTGTQTGMGFDLGIGVYLNGKNWDAGIAVKHLPGSNIKLGERWKFKTNQLFTAMGSYAFALPDKKYKIEPSAIIYTDFKSFQFNVSALLKYEDKYWGGIGYSLENAVSFILGAEIINGLNLAYCYDLPASKFIMVTHGSHEISLSYEFNLLRNKTTNKHKSIRIL